MNLMTLLWSNLSYPFWRWLLPRQVSTKRTQPEIPRAPLILSALEGGPGMAYNDCRFLSPGCPAVTGFDDFRALAPNNGELHAEKRFYRQGFRFRPLRRRSGLG